MTTSDRVQIADEQQGHHYRELLRQHGSPLLLLDCDALRRQYQTLQQALPQVGLYYAVKSLPHPQAVQTLTDLGCGLDIATPGEIEMLQRLSVTPQRCIHTHPIKTDTDIRAALRFGCTTFVVDNALELQKFVRYRERVGLLLRVSFRSGDCAVDLSKKFGCQYDQVRELLQQAYHLGVHIKGLSFHVGSQSLTAAAHVQAIRLCSELLGSDYPCRSPMRLLDIGGGFPVSYQRQEVDIDAYCQPLREALATLPTHVEVIAEPGRYLSAPAMQSVASIVGKAQRGDSTWYYLDDGIYGSYSGQLFDHMCYPLTVFSPSSNTQLSVLAGPTCDSIDVVAEQVQLPDMGLGDIVVGEMMGAYTAATATTFNSLARTPIVVVNDQQSAEPRLSHC